MLAERRRPIAEQGSVDVDGGIEASVELGGAGGGRAAEGVAENADAPAVEVAGEESRFPSAELHRLREHEAGVGGAQLRERAELLRRDLGRGERAAMLALDQSPARILDRERVRRMVDREDDIAAAREVVDQRRVDEAVGGVGMGEDQQRALSASDPPAAADPRGHVDRAIEGDRPHQDRLDQRRDVARGFALTAAAAISRVRRLDHEPPVARRAWRVDPRAVDELELAGADLEAARRLGHADFQRRRLRAGIRAGVEQNRARQDTRRHDGAPTGDPPSAH